MPASTGTEKFEWIILYITDSEESTFQRPNAKISIYTHFISASAFVNRFQYIPYLFLFFLSIFISASSSSVLP